MATATKAKKVKAPDVVATSAATIGSGNPGPVAKLADAGQDLDSFLASQGVGGTAPKAAPAKGSKAPLVKISETIDEQTPDGQVKKTSAVDAWVAADRAVKTAEANKQAAASIVNLVADKMRHELCRKDAKFHSSIQVSGDKEIAMLVSRIAGATSPSEQLPAAMIESCLKQQFGDDWKNYVAVESKLVVNPKLGVPDFQKIAAALAQAGLSFGDLVVKDVKYVPTELLHEQQVLDPKVALKAEALRSLGVLKPTSIFLKS